MAWTTPATAVAGTPISATWINTYLRDNMAYVHSGKPITSNWRTVGHYVFPGAFADFDATTMGATISTTTGRVLVALCASVMASGGTTEAFLDVALDGVRLGGTNGLIRLQALITQGTNASFCFVKTGLSIGSHTFRLQGRSPGSCSLLGDGGTPSSFSVVEL